MPFALSLSHSHTKPELARPLCCTTDAFHYRYARSSGVAAIADPYRGRKRQKLTFAPFKGRRVVPMGRTAPREGDGVGPNSITSTIPLSGVCGKAPAFAGAPCCVGRRIREMKRADLPLNTCRNLCVCAKKLLNSYPDIKEEIEGLGRGHRVNHEQELRSQLLDLKMKLWRDPRKIQCKPTSSDHSKVCNSSRRLKVC